MKRRTLLLGALATPALAQGGGVTLLVPFSPGTSIDTLARLAAEHLRRSRGVAAAALLPPRPLPVPRPMAGPCW